MFRIGKLNQGERRRPNKRSTRKRAVGLEVLERRLLLAADFPDLTIADPTSPPSAVSGEQVSVSWFVENVGDGDAAIPVVDRVYASSDETIDSEDTLLAEHQRDPAFPLRAGERYKQHLRFPLTNLPPESKYLLIATDAAEKQAEADELNNVVALPITIELTDFVIVDATATPQGFGFQVEWKSENRGAVPDYLAPQSIYLSTDTTFDPLDPLVSRFSHLDEVGSELVNTSAVPQGDYFLLVVADATHIHLELDEGNNVQAIPVRVTNPDLEIGRASAPRDVYLDYQNEPVLVQWLITDHGRESTSRDAISEIFFSRDEIWDDHDVFLHRETFSAAIQGYEASIKLPEADPGPAFLLVIVDRHSAVLETNEDNNLVALPIEIHSPEIDLSDLKGPAEIVTYEGFDISWVMSNRGPGNVAGDMRLHIYLSKDEVVDASDRNLRHVPVRVPASGQSATASTRLYLTNEESGPYFILLTTPQHRETSALPIFANPPELEILDVAGPLTAVTSDTISIEWTIRNNGLIPIQDTELVDVYLSSDAELSSGDVLVSVPLDDPVLLEHGREYWGTSLARIPDEAAGDYFLLFARHQQYRVGNIHDSLLVRPISIRAPDLTISSSNGPATASLGGMFDIAWTVTNSGSVSAQSNWRTSLYISADQILSANDIFLAFYSGQELSAGETLNQAATMNLADLTPYETSALKPGQYFLLMDVDQLDVQGETNEVNNEGSLPIELLGPDLVVTEIIAPTISDLNAPVSVRYTVKNQGSGTSVKRVDVIYLAAGSSQPATSRLHVIRDTSLAPGEFETIELEVNLGPYHHERGQAQLIIRADALQYNNELDETNNSLEVPLAVPFADLRLGEVNLPEIIAPWGSYELTWRVKNEGSFATESSYITDLYLSADETLSLDDSHVQRLTHSDPLLPGESKTVSTDMTFSSLTVNTRYWILVLDTRQGRPEVLVQPVTVHGPDVTPIALDSVNEIVAGGAAEARWTVRNKGERPTIGSWAFRIYLSNDSTGKFPAVAVSEPMVVRNFDLDVDEEYSSSTTVSIPAATSAGDYFLVIEASPTSENIGDVNISNDRFTVPIHVTAPDLIVTDLQGPESTSGGATADLSWVVQNSGKVPTAYNWKDFVYFSSDDKLDSSDVLIGEHYSTVRVLPPGETYTATLQARVPLDFVGQAYFIVETNPSVANRRLQGEIETGNNARAIPVNVTPVEAVADLIVADIRTSSVTNVLGTLDLEWVEKNFGNAVAAARPQTSIHLSYDERLDSEDLLVANVRSALPLQPGEEALRKATVTIPRQSPFGAMYLLVTVDSWDYFGSSDPQVESNEQNNTLAKTITVHAPDLEVITGTAPSIVTRNETVQLSWTVLNSGTGPAVGGAGTKSTGGWSDSVFLSADEVLDRWDIRIKHHTINHSVDAGMFYTVSPTIQIPKTAARGRHYLLVVPNYSDFGMEMTETDLFNDAYALPITVLAPELEVTSLTISEAVPANGEVEVSWTVTNRGTGSAVGPWKDEIEFYSNSNNGKRTSTSLDSPAEVAAGESYTRTARVLLDLAKGPGTVSLTSDIGEVTGDGFRDNNSQSKAVELTLTVVPANLRGSFVRVSEIVSAGQRLDVTWQVANVGQGKPQTGWSNQLWFSDDAILDDSDRFLGWLENEPSPDHTVVSTASLILPTDMAGQGFLILDIDALDNGETGLVVETDETDNLAVTPILVTELTRPWQNPTNPTDVTADRQTTPLDALVIINEINARRFSDPRTARLNRSESKLRQLFDVTGDGYVTPVDVLSVINEINRGSAVVDTKQVAFAGGPAGFLIKNMSQPVVEWKDIPPGPQFFVSVLAPDHSEAIAWDDDTEPRNDEQPLAFEPVSVDELFAAWGELSPL